MKGGLNARSNHHPTPTQDTHHRQSSILQLLQLHSRHLLLALRLERLPKSANLPRGQLGVLLSARHLNKHKRQQNLKNGQGALGSDLPKRGKGAGVGEDVIGEVGVGLDEGAEAGKHGDSAVLELDGAVSVEGLLVLGETEGVEEAAGLDVNPDHVRGRHPEGAAATAGGEGGGGHLVKGWKGWGGERGERVC